MYTIDELTDVLKFEASLSQCSLDFNYQLPKPQPGEPVAIYEKYTDDITGEQLYRLKQ